MSVCYGKANNNDPNLVLLDHEIGTVSPQVMPDGNTLVWRVEGTYLFGMKRAFDVEDSLPVMVSPWVAAAFTDLNVGSYAHGIIDDPNGTYSSGSTGPNS